MIKPGLTLLEGIIGIIGAVKYIPGAVLTHLIFYCGCLGWNIGTFIWTSKDGFNQRDKYYEAALGLFIVFCSVCNRHHQNIVYIIAFSIIIRYFLVIFGLQTYFAICLYSFYKQVVVTLQSLLLSSSTR